MVYAFDGSLGSQLAVPAVKVGLFQLLKMPLYAKGKSFHYNKDYCRWTFYDPEFPKESDQLQFRRGLHYWILVKEPVKAILSSDTRHLTCYPEGDCWNQMVW